MLSTSSNLTEPFVPELSSPVIKNSRWWKDPSQTHIAVTLPTYWLRRKQNDPGIGKFTGLPFFFKEELAPRGVDTLFLLPLFAVEGESPYAVASPFALNELYIDWADVVEVQKIPELCDDALKSIPSRTIQYDDVRSREALIALRASQLFFSSSQQTERHQAFSEFAQFHAFWLDDYAEWMALRFMIRPRFYTLKVEEIQDAKATSEFEQRVQQYKYAQWIAQQQLRQQVLNIHTLGGHILFDMPMFRARNSVDAWKHPEYFKDVKSRYAGVAGSAWLDLALWNWTQLQNENYEPLLTPIRYWLDFGFDGARLDHLDGAYLLDLNQQQLASGDEPGDAYVEKVAAIGRERGALLVAEALGGTIDAIQTHDGLLAFSRDWSHDTILVLSNHDNQRLYTSEENFTQVFRQALYFESPHLSRYARFISFTVGDEYGDPLAVKTYDEQQISQWNNRQPLERDTDYTQRYRYADPLSVLVSTGELNSGLTKSEQDKEMQWVTAHLNPSIFTFLDTRIKSNVLSRANVLNWMEVEYERYEAWLITNLRHPNNSDVAELIHSMLQRYAAEYLIKLKRLPEETLVIIMAAGLGTRLNCLTRDRWIDKNTEKLGGVSQLQRQLNMLLALGYHHILVINNKQNEVTVLQETQNYPDWVQIETATIGGFGWMEDFTAAVRYVATHANKFIRIHLLNGEAIVPMEYLAKMRYSTQERIFGFHPYQTGFHKVEIYAQRITNFDVQPNAGTALLTLVAPLEELLGVVNNNRNLENYIAQFFDAPSTSAFKLAKSVPDLNTPEQLQARQAYHFHNTEIIGPFPYEQMVHPNRLARSILIVHGYFYSIDDIEPDDLHDANNRATVWFTKDRQLVIKAFLEINDSRYETGTFSPDRYLGELRFLTRKTFEVNTPRLLGKDDDLKVIIMNHVIGKHDYYNLADMITHLPKADWRGRNCIVKWIEQWMKILTILQKESPQLWAEEYLFNLDLQHTEEQVMWLQSCGYDMDIWKNALTIFHDYYLTNPSPEVVAQGDYAPLNFIIAGKQSFLVDGEFCGRAPREKDLATGLIRLHQMNMRTAYIAPNPHLEENFDRVLTNAINSYERHSGYCCDRITLFFFMAQDLMQRAYDQINFKNDSLSPRQYLELSKLYLEQMLNELQQKHRRQDKGTEEAQIKKQVFGLLARDVFKQAVEYTNIFEVLRYENRLYEVTSLYQRSINKAYFLNVFMRMTLEREHLVRNNALRILEELGFDLKGITDTARDYRYIGYRSLERGDLLTAIRLFDYARYLHSEGPYPFKPYAEKMKTVIALLKQIDYLRNTGIVSRVKKPGTRILITGASGFLGARVLDLLVTQTEDDVTLVLIDHNPPNIERWSDTVRQAYYQGKLLYEKSVDLRDPVSVETIFNLYGGFTEVIHLAAMTQPMWSKWHPSGTIDSNVPIGMYYMCASYRSRLIQISTSELYSYDKSALYTETDSIDPTNNPYSASKFLMEQIPILLGIPVINLRLANLYGTGQKDGIIHTFTQCLLSNQPIVYYRNVILDFLHVEDAAEGIVTLAIEHPNVQGLFNLSSGVGFHIYKVAQMIKIEFERTTKTSIPEIILGQSPNGELFSRVLSNEKASLVFGFHARPFSLGIKEIMREEAVNSKQVELEPSTPIAESSIQEEKARFLETYQTIASEKLHTNSLEGLTFGEYRIGYCIKNAPGRVYMLLNPSNENLFVTAGWVGLENWQLITDNLPLVLRKVGYSSQYNLTVWSCSQRKQDISEDMLTMKGKTIAFSRDGYLTIGDWIYLADIPLNNIKNIPSQDGYWVHQCTYHLLSNEQISWLLLRGGEHWEKLLGFL